MKNSGIKKEKACDLLRKTLRVRLAMQSFFCRPYPVSGKTLETKLQISEGAFFFRIHFTTSSCCIKNHALKHASACVIHDLCNLKIETKSKKLPIK